MQRGQSLSLLLIIAGSVGIQSPQKWTQRGESRFALEQPVNRPVAIPDGVLHTLSQEPDVVGSSCWERAQPSKEISSSWFEASQIHLARTDKIDLLVKAKDGCLFGANIGPFWIFRGTGKKYELVLAVSALGVEILDSKTNGYRDISAGAVASGRSVRILYKFDGRRYREMESESQPIN